MSQQTILKVENISKQYRLGNVGTGTLSHDLNRWWHRMRGKEDPYLKIGAVNDRSATATEDYVWAIKDINFELQQGEVLGIIGKNGAGKSTLLKILSRVTSPTTGSIKAKGRIASLLEVGTGFHPELTGKENIFLNGAILGMNKEEISGKLEDIIEFSGCKMYIDTPVKRYSSGMHVRLAFAVAAFMEPDILVVDEVLAVGDAEFQKKAIGKMQDISKGEGRTVIFVSHNMASIENLCTRCIILKDGSIKFSGDTESAIKEYLKDSFSQANWSFESNKGRTGSGDFLFKNLIFNDNEVVISGETLHLTILYEAKRKIENLKIALTFYKNIDQPIYVIDNYIQGQDISLNKGLGEIKITVPNFRLMPNDYFIDLWSSVNDEVADYIVNKTTITVSINDIYNSGRMLNFQKHGFVVPELCRWEHNSKY